MKCYKILNFNKDGQYCGHVYYAVADDEDITDFIGKHDRASDITEQEWATKPAFYRYATARCAKEANRKQRSLAESA